jgi:hypothetical protein
MTSRGALITERISRTSQRALLSTLVRSADVTGRRAAEADVCHRPPSWSQRILPRCLSAIVVNRLAVPLSIFAVLAAPDPVQARFLRRILPI